ncbi:RUN domain-containing protein 1 [Patella vulgata]|uniref:RUN domain-containing protein 1 n=1 Tax=Patella vulgata TaxID=6465 RepID=UPI002180518A|nr:RUN domain-containing protein 1 [Patella vulgata]
MAEPSTSSVDTGNEAFDYDSFDEQNHEKPAERWAPLGAASSPIPSPHAEASHHDEDEKLRKLEDEQEQLNSSLLALTTHFAQVQFRLKQIVSAPAEDKENLLKELEQFAFRGIPDVRGCHIEDAQLLEEMSEKEHEVKISQQREKQKELIQQLKSQLEDLETYAYETGNAELPTTKVIEKQKIVIDELKQKIDLDLHNFDFLSPDDLKQVVDHAIGQIVNPAKVKEKLVDQLQTQITDLERFIQFLQGEASSPGPLGKKRCTCLVHSQNSSEISDCPPDCCIPNKHTSHDHKKKEQEHLKHSTTTIMKKVLTVLQIYVISQLGCGSREFKRNLMKKTPKGNHWGDLRAKLEVAINKTLETVKAQAERTLDSDEFSDDSTESDDQSNAAVVQCIRRDLAIAIKDLMEHGLMEVGQSRSVVPFGCFPSRSAAVTRSLHAWDLLLKYYEMKHGREYNDSPARKLSQSFHLDIVGGKPITAKQTLLGAIDTIVTSHTPLKRSEDSHFKAFICMALNERKLVTWLRLLFRTQTLIDLYYQDWSYVARTGFDDALKALDRLNTVEFILPVDIAVRPFSKIRDAF